jgi:hypothetical protein
VKKCQSKVIDSLSAAQSLEGCNIIQGSLEINIRTDNCSEVRMLEQYLSEITEITDYLKVQNTKHIYSLSFLKSLKKIGGNYLDVRHSLVLMGNENLEKIWNDNQEVEIVKGQMKIQFNPLLAFDEIKKMVLTMRNGVDDNDLAIKTNGNRVIEIDETMQPKASDAFSRAALLEWTAPQNYQAVSYEIYYMKTEAMNVSHNGVIGECREDETDWSFTEADDRLGWGWIQSPLLNLEPYQSYAFFVKTFVRNSQQPIYSKISYFKTLPSVPKYVENLVAVAESNSEIVG